MKKNLNFAGWKRYGGEGRVTEKELTYDELDIKLADVYAQMGYRAGGALPYPSATECVADEMVVSETVAVVADVRRWLRARFVYVTRPDIPAVLHPGGIIARQLAGSTAYALFIATAGAEYEEYLRRLRVEGDEVRAYIADALGSVIAERCADALEGHLQASIDKLGWRHTNRFSPGYCGWAVDEQRALFPLFGGHTCGVSLTEGALMVPLKSVSGIIGLGAEVTRRDYACRMCGYEKCYKRQGKATADGIRREETGQRMSYI